MPEKYDKWLPWAAATAWSGGQEDVQELWGKIIAHSKKVYRPANMGDLDFSMKAMASYYKGLICIVGWDCQVNRIIGFDDWDRERPPLCFGMSYDN